LSLEELANLTRLRAYTFESAIREITRPDTSSAVPSSRDEEQKFDSWHHQGYLRRFLSSTRVASKKYGISRCASCKLDDFGEWYVPFFGFNFLSNSDFILLHRNQKRKSTLTTSKTPRAHPLLGWLS